MANRRGLSWAVIGQQLGGAISDFTERRMLSANAGEVLIMPANRCRTGAGTVVFVGLGSYDEPSLRGREAFGCQAVGRAPSRSRAAASADSESHR